jgi:multidrug resistance efflux pump
MITVRTSSKLVLAARWSAVVLVILVAAGAALGLYWRWSEEPHELRLPGIVETQEVRLSSRVGGRVAKVLVRESQIVEPGQALVELEMPELDAQRARLVADREAAQAVLERLENGPRPEELAAARAAVDSAQARLRLMLKGYREEEIVQSKKEMESFQAELDQAQADLSRERSLLPTGATTKAAFDAAFARSGQLQGQVSAAAAKLRMMEMGYRPEEVAESEADLDRLQANYDLLQAGTREEEKKEARARVASLAAQIDEIDVRRAERTVTAPERATVEVLWVRPGDIVSANQPVVRVVRAADLWVKAYISEVDLGRIRLRQQVEVTIDAFPGQRFAGEITHINSVSEFTPRNIQTIDERRHQVFGFKVRVADTAGIFKSGIAADVWLPLAGPRGAAPTTGIRP